jgi:hypothetical protein
LFVDVIVTAVLPLVCRANTPLLSEAYLRPTEPDITPLSALMIAGIVYFCPKALSSAPLKVIV